jgi:hypothetical protein
MVGGFCCRPYFFYHHQWGIMDNNLNYNDVCAHIGHLYLTSQVEIQKRDQRIALLEQEKEGLLKLVSAAKPPKSEALQDGTTRA